MGFGDRGQIYASYAKKCPDKFEVVGCVDPDPVRLALARSTYNLSEKNCFINPDDFYARDKLCDAVINATMDSLHYETTMPLLDKGYHVLLEKPVSCNPSELRDLEQSAKRNNRVLMVCHVLRYAPFYTKIKSILSSGELGRVIHMYASENVGIAHVLSSYIRGKWGSERECGSGMLMAKCCHDIDLLLWLKGDSAVDEVSSFGARSVFTSGNKPSDAGTRCTVDCKREATCPYSAKKLYLDHDEFPFLVWSGVPGKDWREISRSEREKLLATTSPHGLCAYADRDLVDHQSVIMRFADGATATLDMTGGATRAGREIHIVCECGEIEGFLESNEFVVRRYVADEVRFDEEKVLIKEDVSGAHSGGDLRLAADFVSMVAGEKPSVSCTSIADSVAGHLAVIAAEISRRQGRAVKLCEKQNS